MSPLERLPLMRKPWLSHGHSSFFGCRDATPWPEGHCPLRMSIILNLDLSLATISEIPGNNNYFKIESMNLHFPLAEYHLIFIRIFFRMAEIAKSTGIHA